MDKAIPELILDYYLYFCFMAFLGWIIESSYKSSQEHRFVNAGFLSGPFVPIYGFGALIISLISLRVARLPQLAAWSIIILSPTILEYFGSLILEKVFGLTLWDYRDQNFHVNGRICLKFSIYWAVLAVFTKLVLEPFVLQRIDILGLYYSHFLAGALSAYFLLDIIHSANAVFNFKAFLNDLAALKEKGAVFLPSFHDLGAQNADGKLRKLPAEVRRLLKPLSSFPTLRKAIKPKLGIVPEWIRERMEKHLRDHNLH